MERTINEVFKNRVQKYKNKIAIEKKLNGKWHSASWNEYYDNARKVGLALTSLGLNKGDRVAILSENRLEWLYTDMGTLGIGVCLIPIYTTLTSEEVEYLIINSGSKIVVVEDKLQLEKVLEISENCPELKKIVVIDDAGVKIDGEMIDSFQALLNAGEKMYEKNSSLYETLSESVTPEDLATIVYTSGTTGLPKGVMITHKNIMAVIHALDSMEPKFGYDTDQTVPFLPLSHVFERTAGHFYGMYVGLTASYAESLDTFANDIQDKKPTVVLAVPRVCEKVYQKILMQVENESPLKKKIFNWGLKVGAQISEIREKKKSIPPVLSLQYKIAYNLIFKKISSALGGRVRWMTASGAPTSKDIIQFFNAAGIMVVEGYGMTECCAPATMSNLSDYKIGTVGKPIPGVEVKLADDGEILIKGDNVFKGYWQLEEETEKTFTRDGYLRTGDIGEFDGNGFLSITDRKKDLIITSGGKNIAPQKIEGLFKFDPLFAQFIVVGERKKFLSALVNINLEQAEIEAKKNNIDYQDPEDLLRHPKFLALVDEHVKERNSHLARYETIKKYKIIEGEFSQDNGELTASLKMKRNVIYDKHKDLIEMMYV